jgi:DNA primase catalytic core
MEKIANLEVIIPELKSYLKQYLTDSGTVFKYSLFTCPNRGEHSHEDKKPSCGFIPDTEETVFNCFSCLPGYELIRTQYGLIKISDIKIGDKVFSHDGEIHNVSYVQNKKSNNLYDIQLENCNNIKNTFTNDHLVATIKDIKRKIGYIKSRKNGLPRNRFCKKLKYERIRDTYKNKLHIEYNKVEKLTNEDYLIFPTLEIKTPPEYWKNIFAKSWKSGPKPERIWEIKIDEEIMWLFGFFCGDGHAGKRLLSFMPHIRQVEYKDKIVKILSRFNKKVVVREYWNDNRTDGEFCIDCSNVDLAQFFRGYFGVSDKKTAPYEICTYPLSYQKAFLDGLMAADGSFNSKIGLIAPNLIHILQQICINLQLPFSKKKKNSFIDNATGIKRKDIYYLNILRKENLKCFYDMIDGHIYCFQKIKSVKKINNEERVYDITVDDSNNFITENFLVHNCGIKGDLLTAYSIIENKSIKGNGFYIAIKDLADRYGIKYELVPLSEAEKKVININKFLHLLLDNATKYLKTSDHVLQYLKSRKWNDLIDHFQFGWLPDTDETKKWIENFYQKIPYLQDYISINPYQIVNRLIFPIKDSHGNIIGLCDRKISDSDTRPKYQKYFLKTLESGEVLFNLSNVYEKIILVEGGSSVFTLHNNNIRNGVSMLGLAFTDNMYKKLVENGIKKVSICYDGDEAGQQAIKKIIKFFEIHPDIICYIKKLENNLDPDDFINQFSVSQFKEIPEESIFDYQIKNYITEKDELKQSEYKNSIFEILYNTKDLFLANKMVDHMVKELKINKKLVLEELSKFTHTKNSKDVSVSSIIIEEQHLLDNIEKFEQRSLRSGELIGISTKFPVLDNRSDGLQIGLVLVSGKWNTGKSAYMQTIALNMLQDPSNFVCYFSIDDSVTAKTIPRLLSIKTKIPINIVQNPIYKIEKNDNLTPQEKTKLLAARENGIRDLKLYSGRLGVKDCIDGNDTKTIEKTIAIYRMIAKNRNLIIFVDFLNMVTTNRSGERTEQESMLAEFFKNVSNRYSCPVICTVESSKAVLVNTDEFSIKGSSSLSTRSDLTLLLSSDFGTDPSKSKMKFLDDNGKLNPIVRVSITKNKFAGFRGDLYYRFYNEISTFEEMTEDEMTEIGVNLSSN